MFALLSIVHAIGSLARREGGEALAEYSLVLALVAVVAVAAVVALGATILIELGSVAGAL